MSVPQDWTPPTSSASHPGREHVLAGLRGTDEGGTDLVQLLTPEGERVPDPRFDRYAADVDVEMLKNLYRDLVLVRRFDREGNALQRQGQLGIWVPLLGQEAAQIGAGRGRPDTSPGAGTFWHHCSISAFSSASVTRASFGQTRTGSESNTAPGSRICSHSSSTRSPTVSEATTAEMAPSALSLSRAVCASASASDSDRSCRGSSALSASALAYLR